MISQQEVWSFCGTFNGATCCVQMSPDGTNWINIPETICTANAAFVVDAVRGLPLRGAVISGSVTSVVVSRAAA